MAEAEPRFGPVQVEIVRTVCCLAFDVLNDGDAEQARARVLACTNMLSSIRPLPADIPVICSRLGEAVKHCCEWVLSPTASNEDYLLWSECISRLAAWHQRLLALLEPEGAFDPGLSLVVAKGVSH